MSELFNINLNNAYTIVRTCGQCCQTLNNTNTGELREYQPNCNHCTKHPITYGKYKRLLAFCKEIAQGESSLNSIQENAACYDAQALLKEIGELDE